MVPSPLHSEQEAEAAAKAKAKKKRKKEAAKAKKDAAAAAAAAPVVDEEADADEAVLAAAMEDRRQQLTKIVSGGPVLCLLALAPASCLLPPVGLPLPAALLTAFDCDPAGSGPGGGGGACIRSLAAGDRVGLG